MNLGTNSIDAIKLGTTNIAKAYLGTSVVYPADGYDIFLIVGQSNSYAGEIQTSSGDTQPDATLDASDADIFQLKISDNTIILATEPLQHDGTQNATWISAWLTFAKMYKAQGYLTSNRDILLVHAGLQTTSYYAGDWNPNDTRYELAITRAQTALAAGTGTNRLKAILYQLGEDDSYTASATYEASMLAMIDAMRTDLNAATVPFLVGGMTPQFVATDNDGFHTEKQIVEDAHADIGNNRSYTAYANPSVPTELPNKQATSNHFSGRGVRGYPTHDFNDYTTLGMAGRHWVAYLAALNNH